MGNLNAAGFAEAVREGYGSLRTAVAANLRSNHFPPLPLDYVEPVVEAIEAAQDGVDFVILLPGDINPVPRAAVRDSEEDPWQISSSTLLDITHSWAFVQADEED